ncbi:MAG TPA: Ig-like domain-containing protein [Thermoanaerobaculia bacterium]|nr:Ig-like domain-containing protein [Thermoanaerobaculia bacterium]
MSIRTAKLVVSLLAVSLAAALPLQAGDAFTITPPFVSNAISSCKDLSLSGQVVVDSAGLSTSVGSNSGNVVSNGNVKATGQVLVNGNATAGPGKAVQISGKAVVTGLSRSASTPYDCTPLDLTQLTATLQATNDNARIPVSAKGVHVLSGTSFAIDGQDSITLPAGTYYFTSFNVTGGAKVLLAGPVRILCTGGITINGGAAVNYAAAASSNNAFLLHLWSSGTTFSLANSTLYGFVYAPAATATVVESRLAGTLFASAVTVSGNAHVTRLVDNVNPQIAITAPVNNTVVSDSSHVLVTGTVSDDTAVTVQVNGQPATIAADGTWSVTLNLSGGSSPVTITATATDAANNIAVAKVSVITIAPPVLSLTLPPPGSFVNSSTVTLSGGAGTATSVTVNGTPATITNGTWSLQNFNLGGEGSHTLTISGTNGGGSSSINPAPSLIVDLTPPAISATVTPAPNAAGWNSTPVTVSFTCSDALSGILTCPSDVSVAADGVQTFTRQATDKAGNVKPITVTVNVDTQKPHVTIASPADNSPVSDPSHVAVTGSVTSISPATVKVNGQTATVAADGTWSATVDLTSQTSPATITAVATNAVGATGSAQISVITIPPPTLSLALPQPGSFVSSSSVTLSGGSGTATSVTVNGTPATIANGTWTVQGFDLGAEGPHTLTIVGTNAAGPATISPTLTVDLTPPTIEAHVAPAPNAAGWNNSDVTVSFTCSDALSGIATCPADVVLHNDVAGQTVTSEAVDKAGNHNSASVTVSIDTGVPHIAITSPADNSVVSDPAHVAVLGNVSDISPVTVTVNGQPATVGANGLWQATLDLSGIASPVTITAVATNAVANTASAHVSVVTVPKPVLSLTLPAPDSFVNTSTVDLAGGSGNATSVTVNGTPATVSNGHWTVQGFNLGAEGAHALTIVGTNLGGSSTLNATLTVDLTPPEIHASVSPQANANGWNNTAVTITYTCSDTLSGIDTCPPAATIDHDGAGQTITATAVDKAGNNSAPATVVLNIDTQKPALTITTPAANAVLTAPQVVVTGGSDDATSVTVNGIAATVDTTAKTFTATISLAEGPNTIAIEGTDPAGNKGSASVTIDVDSRAPQLVVNALPACTNAAALNVSGRVSDTHPAGSVALVLNPGNVTASAPIAADGTWSASLQPVGEGSVTVVATANDSVGHSAVVSVSTIVDRTKPTIQLLANGSPFSGGAINHAVGITARVTDADANTAVTLSLSGAAYTAGTVIPSDGSYTIVANAQDCAGNATSISVPFTIDTNAPELVSIDPADGSVTADASKAITGTVREADLQSAAFDGGAAATVSGTAFTFHVPLVEGANNFVLVLTDNAGNVRRVPYSFTLKTTAPAVEIDDSGVPIPNGALFNRNVTPVVRSSDPNASIDAKLDGQPYPAPATQSADKTYAMEATADDRHGHVSPKATVTFTIDKTPPDVHVTAPADGATVATATTTVTVSTTATDVATVNVNGVNAVKGADGNYTATVNLDFGENSVAAVATDRAGNSATAIVTVTRNDGNKPGIVLTSPGDGTRTNRPTTVVIGQVLTPGPNVTVNGTTVTPNAAGAFRLDDFALHEGDNAITATIAGTQRSVTVHVLADFTPPVLHVNANGSELAAGQRFDTAPSIALQASDNSGDAPATTLTIDGIDAGAQIPALGNGGHSLTATATDKAGNRTRVDLTFFVGSLSAGSGACSMSGFSPADQSVVLAQNVTITGRTTATNILVNGQLAQLDSGSFAKSVQLAEGTNSVTIRCADASGTATGDAPVTLTYYRVTSAPTVTITAPHNGDSVGVPTAHVTGTVSADAISGDVNGTAFTPAADHTFAADVSLANGLNLITARARNRAGAVGAASVNVVAHTTAPKISITSPLPSTQTSATTLDVTGTYSNVKLDSIVISANGHSAPAVATPTSDTTGTFSGTATLSGSALITITVTATNGYGLTTTATVDILPTPGPSITITAPKDNTFYPSTATAPDAITGTIAAEDGATVFVNGVQATLTGAQFTATVPFSGTGVNFPVIARVTTPSGASATDSIRVVHLAAPLTVKQAFPDANAAGVDIGAVAVILFSNPIAGSTVTNAVTLVDDANTQITGTPFTDNDAVSFAPNAPLLPGRHYTLRVSQALKDLAGGTLAQSFSTSFTTAGGAPATGPTVTADVTGGCITTAKLTGTASAAGARIRIDVDGSPTTVTAAADRSFTATVGFSGQPGFHVARVVELGGDGTASPETDVQFNINCSAPQVVAANLNRATKTLTVQFSTAMNPATLTAGASGTIQLAAAGSSAFSGTVTMDAANKIATVVYTADLTPSLTLTVTKSAATPGGTALAADFTTSFPADSQTPLGSSYVAGAVYDASTGRPLIGASVVINPGNISTVTFDHGRYTRGLAEGAYTIEVTAPGYTKVWRQIVIPAGTGVTPIDIRLTQRGPSKPGGTDLTLPPQGGDTPVTKRVTLTVPAASLTSAHTVAATSLGGQSLAGLLPLGWSPYAAAEVVVDDSAATPAAPLSASKLSFDISAADAAAIAAASQTLAVVQYDDVRDEWRTLVAVATIADTSDPNVKRVTADISTAGNYALVYGDKAANLVKPAAPRTGAVLQGVANPCSVTPDTCRMPNGTLNFDKPTVAPSEHSVATLRTDGTTKTFPSGTAVQAYIDELLNLADGSVRIDPPFATDLLLYRNFDGSAATSVFHLAPTTDAAKVTLRDGADHVHIVDYPGRIDRGALLGSEGGRIPGDDTISIDLPAGATIDPIHASLTPTHDTGAIAGFHIVGGFTVALTRSEDAPPVDIDGDGKPDAIPVTLLKPMRGTFTIDETKFATANRQLIVAEVLGKTAYGKVLRIAATTTLAATQAPSVKIFTTAIPAPVVPLDGIIRDGQYLLLAADAPIAYAYGTVRASANGPAIAAALVQSGSGSGFAPALDVADVARIGGGFTVPVAAQPASPFSLRPHTVALGDGQVVVAASSPAPDVFVPFGDLVLTPQPLQLNGITPGNNDEVAATAQVITATFNLPIDRNSIDLGIIVNNVTTNTAVGGSIDSVGSSVTFTPSAPLASGSRFAVSVQPTIRSTAGAPLGRTVVSYFTTQAAPPANSQIHPELITITIPVNGISTVTGRAGAIPAGDNAVLVREGHDFIVRYQKNAASDGSFTFTAGGGATDDRLDMLDAVDLQIVDATSSAVVAVLPLTFVTVDGNGFLAAPNKTATFTAPPPLSVSVTVPAGAFDVPTVVQMSAAPQSDFADVPSIDAELGYFGGVTLSFDGQAKKPLDLDLPIPQGTTTTGRTFALGRLGQTSQGPRVEIDDLISVDGNKFTTRDIGGAASHLRVMSATSKNTKPNEVLTANGGGVTAITVTNGGKDYTSTPTVKITGGGGSGATAEAVINVLLDSITVTNGGTGYTSAPTVSFSGGGQPTRDARATAKINVGIANIQLGAGGSGYTSAPTVSFVGGGGTGASATANVSGGAVTSVTLANSGSGFTSVPSIVFNGGGGSGATATATLGGTVTAITIDDRGAGYTSAPSITLTGGGNGATASAVMSSGTVTSVNVTNHGTNYASVPTVEFSGGGGTGAAATALVSAGVRQYLLHVIASGKYAVTDLGTGGTPAAFVYVNDIQSNLNLFWDAYHSLFVSQLYVTAGHGRVVMPVKSGSPFTVDAVDAATGIKMFSRTYDGPPVAPPGQAAGIPPLQNDTVGPYPVYGSPFVVQVVDIPRGVDHFSPMPGVKIDMPWGLTSDQGNAAISLTGAAVYPRPHLQALNTRNGDLRPDGGSSLSIAVKAGDRIIIMTGSEPVEPRAELSVVFNEALFVPTNTPAADHLAQYIKLERNFGETPTTNSPNPAPDWRPLGGVVSILADSGNRRVQLNAPLETGTEYRLRLDKSLAHDFGGSSGLTLGSPAAGTQIGDDVYLYFSTRKPAGDVLDAAVKLAKGTVRDLALDGNLLFVSAQEGGLLAYDAGDAGRLDTATPIGRGVAIPDGTPDPPGVVPPIPGAAWAVEVDKHGRVWTTALTSMFGVVRTFRTEAFANATPSGSGTIPIVEPFAGGTVSWRPGATVGLDTGLSTTILSDRPEATPRKMQLVLQDDSLTLTANAGPTSSADLDKALQSGNTLGVTGGSSPSPLDEFTRYHFTVPTSGGTYNPITHVRDGFPYLKQRISIRNVTAGLRWSQDSLAGPAAGPNGGSVNFDDVLVRPGDTLVIERNMATYGVVSHFGYGIGVYDLNAIESNSLIKQWPTTPVPKYADVATQIALTSANEQLTFSPDAAVTVDSVAAGTVGSPTIHAFALVPAEGIMVVDATPLGNSIESNGDNTTSAVPLGGDVSHFFYQLIEPNGLPELAAIRQIVRAGGRFFIRRFNSISRFDRANKSYVLVSGGQYGILVFDVTHPSPNLVDVIWLERGAFAVRNIGNNYATAIDGMGKAVLIDLSHVDESGAPRVDVTGAPWNCGGCAKLFPTVAAALRGGPDPAEPYKFGNNDPRVVWVSERLKDADGNWFGVTTLAPVADPETGLLYDGALLQNSLRILSAIDPRITMMVNLGGGKLTSVNAVVPLGIAPNAATAAAIAALPPCTNPTLDNAIPTSCRENASMGAFRIETSLPGKITDLVPQPRIAIESERVAGAVTEQTREPLPPSHIRQFRTASSPQENRGTTGFVLRRVIGDSYPNIATLRLQKGFNKFVSPWVVAIADPRASSQYTAPRAGEDDGCFSCALPQFLQNKQRNTDFFEIYTNGRYLAVRPEVTAAGSTQSIFDSAGHYKYLGAKYRVFGRFGTIPADTIRPPQALVAANAPPVTTGKLLETVYLHSGEVESSSVDLDAGGRAGWNVVFDRTYRSRTLGTTPMGFGWDSGIFKRLRFLPNGDVEYRDGAEIWRYRFDGANYKAPTGYSGHLLHTQQGWTLIGQKFRITYFDELGRVVREADEFYTPGGDGNAINYLYDDDGRLATIVDSTNRATKLDYYKDVDHEGLLQKVTDWRTRELKYDFDDKMRLKTVELPKFTQAGAGGGTINPQRTYDYDASTGGTYKDDLELATNLTAIRDPNEAPSGSPRVSFGYGGGNPRDNVKTETWGTPQHETATFGIASGTATTTDVLGQRREYTFQMPPTPAAGKKLDWYSQDRAHVLTMSEKSVETYAGAAFGILPPTPLTPGPAPTSQQDRNFTYAYDTNGYVKTETLDGVYTKSYSYKSAGDDLGFIADCSATAVAGTSLCGTTATPGANDVKMTTTFRPGGFIDAISSNGLAIDSHEPGRDALTPPDDVNNHVTSHSVFYPTGLPHTTETSGGTCTPAPCTGSMTETHYYDAAPGIPAHQRGLPSDVKEGTSNGVVTTFDYSQGPDKTKVTDARNVSTTTEYDEWRRPKTVITELPGDPLKLKEEYVYDATGNLKEHHRWQGGDWVKTTYGYDVLGRRTSVTSYGVAVGSNNNASVTETVDYSSYGSGIVRHIGAANATTTVSLDTLGRTKQTETQVGTSPIKAVTAYDKAGNAVFASDTTTYASASSYDPNGRRIEFLRNDGTTEHTDYDAWGRATDVKAKDRNGNVVYHRHTDFEPAGQVKEVKEDGGTGTLRTSKMTWDGGGRTAAVAADGGGDTRAVAQKFDDAGRILEHKQGTSSSSGFTPILTSSFDGYGSSYVAPTTRTAELLTGHTYTATRGFDTAGNTKDVKVGALAWTHEFDEAGNVTKDKQPSSLPSQPERQLFYDARGNVTSEILPGGATQSHEYHATGSSTAYKDPSPTPEVTSTDTDELGRPTVIHYFDGTFEKINYEGANVLAVKDRQDRWQSFRYENGHVTQVWAGQTPGSGTKLDQIDYVDGAHLTAWTNRDAKIEYFDFTQDGLPKRTVVTHYKDGSGLSSNPQVLDTFTQTHDYNGHGELTDYSLPTGGTGFASSVHLDYDAMGNVKTLQRDGVDLLIGDYAAAGRPKTRKLTLPSGKKLERIYSYKSDTGQLEDLEVKVGNTVVAGSHVDYSNSLQATDVTLKGVSNGLRHTRYSYDARGRVYGSITATTSSTKPPQTVTGGTPTSAGSSVAEEILDPADFRLGQERIPSPDPLTPPSQSATPRLGHKIDTFTRVGSPTRTFDYGGKAERIDDGQFHYHYDEKGRLDWAAEVPTSTAAPIRRIVYGYDGNNRIVGRTAQFATPTTITAPIPYETFAWTTENRSQVLSADGLPAETTFIWDPVTDRLIAIKRTGASANTSDPYNNVLKQVIHGDMGYDDPIESTSIDQSVPVAPGNAPPLVRLYPIFDEAAGGTLQAVVNSDGLVVARSSNNDPFGGEEFDLGGAAIDNVSVTATKTAAGALDTVKVTMRATEPLLDTTLATGARLAVVDANGTVRGTATAQPTLADSFTVAWTLSASDWTALTATPQAASLSVAATNTLRAALWSLDIPILPPPSWATTQRVYSRPGIQVEVRAPLGDLSTFVNGVPNGATATTTPYDVPNLSALAVSGGNAEIENMLAATFQAQPFAEPFTKKFYVRERWYDPQTGTWLTPDPLGYKDSSNLYAYAGGDPVNRTDPAGTDERCKNTTLASAVAVGKVGLHKANNVFESATDALGFVIDKLLPGSSTLFWQVRVRSENWQHSAKETAYDIESAARHPVMVIGGATDKRVQAVNAAASTGCKEEIAKASANGLFDLVMVRAAIPDIETGGFSTFEPQVNTGSTVRTGAGTVGQTWPTPPPTAILATAVNGTNGGNDQPVRAVAAPEKFSNYVFKKGAKHGKAKIFEALGYDVGDTAELVRIYEEQATAKYNAREFTLGVKDQWGQRVDIVIELHGKGAASGEVRQIISGWMVRDNNTITLNTPFSGHAE